MRRLGPVLLSVAFVGLLVWTILVPGLSGKDPADGATRGRSAGTPAMCAKPVAERQGNWFCISPGSGTSRAASTPGGSCNAKGCWTVATDFISTAYMSGSFGYGKKPIGMVYLSAKHQLNGSQMKSTGVSFNATVSLKDLHATGNLLVGSHHGSGETIDGNFDIVARSRLAGGTEWNPWGAGYYSSRDKKHLNHANVIQVSFSYGNYPGYWYVYQKSVIADDPNDNKVYGFNSSTYRFDDSAVGGYRAG